MLKTVIGGTSLPLECVEHRADLAVDGFDQPVVERPIAAPHLPVRADEGLPLIGFKVVALRERLLPEVVDQIRRKPCGRQRSRVGRRSVEDVVDVVRIQPGDDQKQGLARSARAALLQERDDPAGERPIANRRVVDSNPYSPGVAPRCHLPKYAVSYPAAAKTRPSVGSERSSAPDIPAGGPPAAAPAASFAAVFPITPVRWG